MTLSTIRKALTAAGFALVAALGAAMLDGDLTAAEGIASVGFGLAAGAATWRVPNDEESSLELEAEEGSEPRHRAG